MLIAGNVPGAIAEAARRLAEGGLVAFPTETVYGLGARADDDVAVAGIYSAKGRPSGHPLIVHVADAGAAAAFAATLPALAQRLMAAFWPGPLTVIVPRRPGRAAAAAGGQASIGLRSPAHPMAQALLQAAADLGVPGVAAPSANRFGRLSPTRADHVADTFGVDLFVLDGGPCDVGIESAIVDCTGDVPVLLRPGSLSRADIAAAAGTTLRAPGADAPRASGTLASHYTPRAPLQLWSSAALTEALRQRGDGHDAVRLAVYSRRRPARLDAAAEHRPMPEQPDRAARELFAALHDFDRAGAQAIWVEEPPSDPAWDGVRDRLRRAATRDLTPLELKS